MMTGEMARSVLPDHLLERIIAMLPFPSIFQARCLSKSWNARFSQISSQRDKAKKAVAMSFQKLVGENCRNWKTFCPVLISSMGDFVAYDKETNNWQKMPLLSFLPDDVFESFYNVQIEGPLLYTSNTPSDSHDGIFYVANILTQTWKQLPPPPTSDCVIDSSKLVVTDRSSETYKLILFCQRTLYWPDFHFIQIYDSKSESWSSKKTVDGETYQYDFIHNSVHLNGFLYTASCYKPPNLWAFNIEDGTLEERNLNFSRWRHYHDEVTHCQLVVCNNNLFMVTGEEGQFDEVLKIDVKSLALVETSFVPSYPAALNGASTLLAPFGDDCHIYFGSSDEFGRQCMRAYNVKDDFWTCALAPPAAGAHICFENVMPGWPKRMMSMSTSLPYKEDFGARSGFNWKVMQAGETVQH